MSLRFAARRRRKPIRSNRFKRKKLLPFQVGIAALLAIVALIWIKQPGSTCAKGTTVESAVTSGDADYGFFHEQRVLSKSNVSNSTLKIICGKQYGGAVDACSSTEFPADLLLKCPYGSDPNKHYLALHFLGIMYMFAGLSVVCDEFFVSALDVIIEEFEITEDVAGATWMAAGGSAPEFFTSLMGVFVANNDVGFGTIVGSAVFNVLFVIGLCAVFAKQTLDLTWWPLARDCSFYIVGLTALTLFVADDSKIWLFEAAILFVLYIIYVLIMKFNEELKEAVTEMFGGEKKGAKASTAYVQPAESNNDGSSTPPLLPDRSRPNLNEVQTTIKDRENAGTEGGLKAKLLLFRDLRGMALRSLMRGEFDIKTETANTGNSKRDKRIRKMRSILARKRLKAMVKFVGHQALMEKRSSQKLQGIESEEVSEELHKLREIKAKMKSDEEMNADAKGTGKGEVDKKLGALAFEDGGDADGDDGDEGPNNPFEVPEEFDSEFVLWLLCLPVSVPCYLTIPNCGWGGKWKPYYLATFFISLIWISVFAFGMVWWATTICDALSLPPPVMGLTVLAAGTSIPDALSSVIVARQGLGDMAVSSSIGSNIFDILVGLPVPWLLKTAITGECVFIQSESLPVQVITLMMMVAFVILSIMFTNWKLDANLGAIMFLLYIAFVIWSLGLEGNWWGFSR